MIDFGRARQVDPRDPKFQEWFGMEHKQLDSDFAALGFELPLHYHYEERKSSQKYKPKAPKLAPSPLSYYLI